MPEQPENEGDTAAGIGVVVPAHDRPRMLREAVESVLAQEGVAVRLVVVDDASRADLSAVRRAVEKAGHRWIRRERNGGPAAARNTGARALATRWIAFLDSDDRWMPDKLARQIAWHEAHPGTKISQAIERWLRGGREVAKPPGWRQRGGDLFASSVERCSIGPSCVMMRRDLWDECGGFDERFRVCEDYELWLRITARHRVGLAGGGPTVEKRAGHGDQLSVVVPALDRYRVIALLQVLGSGVAGEVHEAPIRRGIVEKCAILAAGAARRGGEERASFYRRLAEAAPHMTAEQARGWADIAWSRVEEIASSVSGERA